MQDWFSHKHPNNKAHYSVMCQLQMLFSTEADITRDCGKLYYMYT